MAVVMPNPGTPEHAPEHVVRELARILPERRSPTRSPEQDREAVLAQARLTADTIWKEAFFSGQVFQRSIEPTRMYLCEGCPRTGPILARVKADERSQLWPCGCLKNTAMAHRVGCPEHPKGVQP